MTPPIPASSGPPRKRSTWEIQRVVLFALVLRELKQRVGGQWIGTVWTIFEPLAHLLILVLIVGSLRASFSPGIEYPVFLVTGLVPYFLFKNLALRLMDGVRANRGVFAYRQVKPFDALLSRAVVESLLNVAVYLLMLGFLAWLGMHVLPEHPLEVMGVHVLIGLLGLSLGIFLAVISHERPRLQSFVRLALIPLYIFTGVIFPIHGIPREYLEWLLWNPMLHLVELSRYSFIAQYQPVEGVNPLYPAACTLAICALGLALYRVKRLQLIAS